MMILLVDPFYLILYSRGYKHIESGRIGNIM